VLPKVVRADVAPALEPAVVPPPIPFAALLEKFVIPLNVLV